MKPEIFYRSLSRNQRTVWAERAGTTFRHVQSMFGATGFRKRPRDRLIVGLVEASDGAVSLDEAIDYFLVQPVRKLAAELGQCSQNELMPPESALEMKALDRPHQRSECGYEGDRAGL